MSGTSFQNYMDEPTERARGLPSSVEVDLQTELAFALNKHPNEYASPHELSALLREEFEEFWELVKSDHSCVGMYQMELLHVAVVALRGWSMYQAKREGGR